MATPPAPGHVHPPLDLVEELVARGHRVTFITGPATAPVVRAAGAQVAELDHVPDTAGLSGDFTAETLLTTLEEYLASARVALPGMMDRFHADPPDLVCCDGVFLGPLIAGAFGVPLVALLANFASNAHFTPDHLIPGMAEAAPRFAAYGAEVGRLAAEYGVPGGGPDPVRTLVFLPRAFQIAGDTFGDDHLFVGPSPSRARTADWRPPADGAPVLLVSLGTAFTDRPEFFAACVAAFADTPRHVVMAIGEHVDPAALGPVPANIEVAPRVPQPAVLRHASAFVTHAGMGSVMEALYAQVPILAAPQIHEQTVNADRVTELGLGYRLAPGIPDPATLRAEAGRLTADTSVRRALAAMREEIRASGGADAAADTIEEILARP